MSTDDALVSDYVNRMLSALTPDQLRTYGGGDLKEMERHVRAAIRAAEIVTGIYARIRGDVARAMHEQSNNWKTVGDELGITAQVAWRLAHPESRKTSHIKPKGSTQ